MAVTAPDVLEKWHRGRKLGLDTLSSVDPSLAPSAPVPIHPSMNKAPTRDEPYQRNKLLKLCKTKGVLQVTAPPLQQQTLNFPMKCEQIRSPPNDPSDNKQQGVSVIAHMAGTNSDVARTTLEEGNKIETAGPTKITMQHVESDQADAQALALSHDGETLQKIITSPGDGDIPEIGQGIDSQMRALNPSSKRTLNLPSNCPLTKRLCVAITDDHSLSSADSNKNGQGLRRQIQKR